MVEPLSAGGLKVTFAASSRRPEMTSGPGRAEPPRSARDETAHGGTLNDRQREVALVRYTLTKRERGAVVPEVASREHIGPYWERVRVASNTLEPLDTRLLL